jgi:hypothetical protein
MIYLFVSPLTVIFFEFKVICSHAQLEIAHCDMMGMKGREKKEKGGKEGGAEGMNLNHTHGEEQQSGFWFLVSSALALVRIRRNQN